jgi:hypothetical protein
MRRNRSVVLGHAVMALVVYACGCSGGAAPSATGQSGAGAGGSTSVGNGMGGMAGSVSSSSAATSGSGDGCVERGVALPTCRIGCNVDSDCCPGDTCGVNMPYPYNSHCDMSGKICRSAECCTDDDCLQGQECMSINGARQCWVPCSESAPCPPPGPGELQAECTGVNDGGAAYCRPRPPCPDTPCSRGQCKNHVCTCSNESNEAECPSSQPICAP